MMPMFALDVLWISSANLQEPLGGILMASVYDVAEFILARTGPLSAMKLQKLAYYSQAWHAVWSDAQLFPERIEAWANGPVVPALYEKHRGQFILNQGQFKDDPGELTNDEADSVARVLKAYGSKTSQWLSDLTHMESPWVEARAGVPDGERSNIEIPLGAMAEYYGAL